MAQKVSELMSSAPVTLSSSLLAGTRALITGGDSGIGRAVAVAFAKEGADVAIAYLSEIEDSDAAHTAELVNTAGQRCVTIRGDLAVEDNIINTSSINGLRGNKTLIDYAATKGAVLALTYSLAQALQDRGIRVNAVAPGPVWTPLIPATLDQEPGRLLRPSGAHGLRRPPGRDRPALRLLRQRAAVQLLLRRGPRPIGGETLPG